MNVSLIKLLLHLKNSSNVNNKNVIIKLNQKNIKVIRLLYKTGFLQSFNKSNNNIYIYFRYNYKTSLLKNLKIVSKPSLNYFIDYNSLCRINSRFQVGFLTTSKGLLTSIECKKKKIGGILLFIC